MRTASLRPLTIRPQICTVCCAKLQKHFKAIGLPGGASDYNEDKRSAVAVRMQSKVVIEGDTTGSWDEILGIRVALKQL